MESWWYWKQHIQGHHKPWGTNLRNHFVVYLHGIVESCEPTMEYLTSHPPLHLTIYVPAPPSFVFSATPPISALCLMPGVFSNRPTNCTSQISKVAVCWCSNSLPATIVMLNQKHNSTDSCRHKHAWPTHTCRILHSLLTTFCTY